MKLSLPDGLTPSMVAQYARVNGVTINEAIEALLVVLPTAEVDRATGAAGANREKFIKCRRCSVSKLARDFEAHQKWHDVNA